MSYTVLFHKIKIQNTLTSFRSSSLHCQRKTNLQNTKDKDKSYAGWVVGVGVGDVSWWM
jgi:hypothetical protein